MNLTITITYNSGEEATYIAKTPEWVKWEKHTGCSIKDWDEKGGISGLMFLAYHALKREEAGKPIKPFEAWIETVSDWNVVRETNPKVMKLEA
jgi:hypothetical protein